MCDELLSSNDWRGTHVSGKKVLSRRNLFSAHIYRTSLLGGVLCPDGAIRLQIYLFIIVYTNLVPTLFLPFLSVATPCCRHHWPSFVFFFVVFFSLLSLVDWRLLLDCFWMCLCGHLLPLFLTILLVQIASGGIFLGGKMRKEWKNKTTKMFNFHYCGWWNKDVLEKAHWSALERHRSFRVSPYCVGEHNKAISWRNKEAGR